MTKQEFETEMEKVRTDPTYRNVFEMGMDSYITAFKKKELKNLSYKIGTISDINLARLEFHSDLYFCSTKYIDLDLLIFLGVEFMKNALHATDDFAKFLSKKLEYGIYPVKAITDGIDLLYENMMELIIDEEEG